MATPPRVSKQATWIAGALTLCTLAANRVLDPHPIANYLMFPGSKVVPFLSVVISIGTTGTRHSIDPTILLALACIVNFVCYLVVIYLFLSLSIRNRDLNIRT